MSPSHRSGSDLEALALSQDPLLFHSEQLGYVLQFQLRHQFQLVKVHEHSWHVSSVAYFYQLSDNSGKELVAWHWHPGRGVDHPHIHTALGDIGKGIHLPSGRVSIESVIRMLIDELGVQPTRDHKDDWREVIDHAESLFLKHRRWSG